MEVSNTRQFTFIVMMGALGNVLFLLTLLGLPWQQIMLDFSHVGTMIAALYGGPGIGVITGSLVGIGPGIYFGPFISGGINFLGLPALILGKAMTGFSVGYFADLFYRRYGSRRSITSLLSVALGYIPEFFFTIAYFKILIPLFIPSMQAFETAVIVVILGKAWVEIVLIGFYMGALAGNKSFSSFMRRMVPYIQVLPKTQRRVSQDSEKLLNKVEL